MSGNIVVIIPAAGKSSRFGGREKKPFASLAGRPVWLRAAELFWTRNNVSRVYLVIPPEDRDEFRTRFGGLVAFTNIEVVDGGEERFDSVANALARVRDSVGFVAVHDAVRPLTPNSVIDAVFAAASEHGAAMPAIPVADTLKQVDPATNRITGTVPRSRALAGADTASLPPRMDRRGIFQAGEIAGTITDDAQLVEVARPRRCGRARFAA